MDNHDYSQAFDDDAAISHPPHTNYQYAINTIIAVNSLMKCHNHT